MATKASNEAIYFTKVRGLASVVWDPENNKPLAEFSKQGLLCTYSKKVAAVLSDMGYRQVTADMLIEAGLPLPDAAQGQQPGKGYLNDGDGRPALIGSVSEEGTIDKLFDPVMEQEENPSIASKTKKTTKRSVV